MPNEEKVNEIALKMLAKAYHQIGYRAGVNDAVRWITIGVTVPFIYMAIKNHHDKKAQEKAEK